MNKNHSIETGSLIVLIMIGLLFGFVPNSHAQSVQTWSQPVNLSNSGTASNPSLVVDNDGIINVLWVDKFDGYKFAKSTDGGATWSAPATVKFPFSVKGTPPVMFSDAKGFIYIFWLSDKNDFSFAQVAANALDNPSSWRVTKLDSSVYDFDVHMDGQGLLHLGYVKNPAPNPGTAGVFYRNSTNGGGSWSAATLLYESSYFRSLTPDEARVRLAVSANPGEKNVYMVWDDRPQKRIFIATSEDSGSTWDPVQELITPQANLGFRTPYHADIDILANKLLVTWQVGEPGTRCTPYSWTSNDNGKTWNAPVQILAGSAGCPESNEFISIDPAYATVLFTIQGDLSLSAWNGSQWSNPEIQTGPSSITDPTTFDAVQLGNERTAIYKDQLYVVGGDKGTGGDVWFVARQLDPLKNLFPLPSAWGGDTNLTTVSQTISSLSSIADDVGNVHVFWIQASGTPENPVEPRIMYAHWNGSEWTSPVPVITGLSSLPLNLSLQIDNSHRLLLSWVNQQTGDLMFTWANSEQANVPLEWMQPVILLATSQSTNSPDIFVDASNRIVIAYAINLNEERGIYLIQSTDLGQTWSTPVRAFDAVAANWQMVDEPKLAVTEDGKMHILFTKYTLLGGQQSAGLFYSQSADGGNTWTTPEAVSEKSVQWSDIIAFKETLHRFWQEKNKTSLTTYHQVSSDGGTTWSSPATLPNDADVISDPSISIDWTGNLHLLQMTDTNTRDLQEWDWKNEHWQLSDTRKFNLPEQDSKIAITSGVTSHGNLYTLFQFESLLDKSVQANLLSVSRSLEITKAAQPFLASISTPAALPLLTATPASQTTPTPDSSLANLGDTQLPSKKNIAGIFLIVGVVVLIILFTVPKRSKGTDGTKQPK